MKSFKWFLVFILFITFIIGFLSGSAINTTRQKSAGAQKINCSIENNFGPNGEVVLIEDITIEKECVNSKNITTYCVLGLFDTEEHARLEGLQRNCSFGE